ncbi:hypothetical protein PCANC_00088 [Puccinia coronata f. sp. avenae]|uniref:Uncharacterized protein n=1 Tax=Puccinia coronata f. sp. avenae TaxID=200324 RepID=A0A2N5W8B7_9BASI|nr:hypothetical protein PCANC_00088 [Puccinia coronata f. sp. avenae]
MPCSTCVGVDYEIFTSTLKAEAEVDGGRRVDSSLRAIPETLKVDSKEEPWDVVKSKDMLQVPMESQPKSESSDLYKQELNTLYELANLKHEVNFKSQPLIWSVEDLLEGPEEAITQLNQMYSARQ